MSYEFVPDNPITPRNPTRHTPLIHVKGLDADTLVQRPPSNKWSIHEHTAHLGRYHEVFLERLGRILDEDRPSLGRYRADGDSGFGSWTKLSPEGVVEQLKARRAELLKFVKALNTDELTRTGAHPVSSVRWTSCYGSSSSCCTKRITSTASCGCPRQASRDYRLSLGRSLLGYLAFSAWVKARTAGILSALRRDGDTDGAL